ncbi:MAG: fasciclin domain-containing protein [Bacteroidota bacterium]
MSSPHFLRSVFSISAFAQTVVDIVVESPDHNTLETAVVTADLVETLSGEGPFTVFAPTDAAFAEIGADVLNSLLADPKGALTDVLFNHVVSGVADGSNISDGLHIGNLLGENLTFTINGDGIFINGAQVTVADIKADNGVVHVIDAVLVPAPKAPELPATVMDIIAGSEVHTQLESLIMMAGLEDDLRSDGPFTVFAPVDAAFAQLPADVVASLTADPMGALASVLTYHVNLGVANTTNIFDGKMVTNLAGNNLNFSVTDDGVFVNGVKVSAADLQAKNGVVHVIDGVLLASTVMDVIANSPDHTQLEALLMMAGLDDDLRGDGPFTVFAPTDAAVGKLSADVVSTLTADPTGALANVLLYHVVSGVAKAGSLSDEQRFATLFGSNVTVSINGDGVFINDAQVTVTDIHTDNGVVHVIDTVLVP